MNIPGSEGRSAYPLPGPGLLIALSSSGWLGLLSLISFGGDTGYTFIGIVLLTLIFKYCLITGLGRYALVTGNDIFTGIASVPGPKHWAVWMLNIILYVEVFMLGYSSLTMARLFIELTGIRISPVVIITLLFSLIFLLVSVNSYWLFRKILIAAVIFIMCGFCWMICTMAIPLQELTAGLVPDMGTYMSVYESSIILSSVGSGFSLLFYSVWLVNHMKGNGRHASKETMLKRMRIDAGIGMAFLFLLCILYLSVGYVFLYEHGLGSPESDLTLEIILTIMDLGISGNLIFVIVCAIALFCSLLGGLYGRARVLQVTLPRTVPGFMMTRRAYIAMVFCLFISAVSSQYFWTLELVRDFITIRLVIFCLVTIILMYVDFRLGPGDRGSRFWYGTMITGAACSLMFGLNLFTRFFL